MPIKLVCLCVRFFTVWWHTQKKNCFSWFFFCVYCIPKNWKEISGQKRGLSELELQSLRPSDGSAFSHFRRIWCTETTASFHVSCTRHRKFFFATHSTLLGWVCAYHMIEIGDAEVWFAGALPGTLIYVCACPSDSVLVPAALSQISSIALFPTWHCSFRLHSQCIPFQFEILTFVIWFRVVFSDFEGKK